MSFVKTLRAKNHITVKLDMEEMDVTVVKMKDMIALQRKKSDNGMDMILKKHPITSVLIFHYYIIWEYFAIYIFLKLMKIFILLQIFNIA